MYIYKIVIENFRNFKSFVWKPNKGVNVIFGENGSGKSNLAMAIDLVFSTSKYNNYFELSDYYMKSDENQIKIQVWLRELEGLEFQYSHFIQYIDKNDNFIFDDDYKDAKDVLILELSSTDEREMSWNFIQKSNCHECKLSARKAIKFFYLSTDRNPNREISLNSNSILHKLDKNNCGFLEEGLSKISPEIVQFANEKISSSKEIEKYLKTLPKIRNSNILNKYDYYVLMKDPDSKWNYSGYEIGLGKDGFTLEFEYQSKGIQNLLLLIFYTKLLANSSIVFVEELEQNLEPKFQKYICNEFRRIQSGQLFVTTHSSEVVSIFNYSEIFYMGSSTLIPIYDNLSANVKKEINRFNRKELISVLMASKVLLVEGDTEYFSFPLYSYINDISLSQVDVEILNMHGKDKAKIYLEFFEKFDKEIYLCFDKDNDINNTLKGISKYGYKKIYLLETCYEDLIVNYLDGQELEDIIPFDVIKSKLIGIANNDNYNDAKKRNVKDFLNRENIDLNKVLNYSDLFRYKVLALYILHDSFTSSYYVSLLASKLTSQNIVPKFFSDLLKSIKDDKYVLEKYNDNDNIIILKDK